MDAIPVVTRRALEQHSSFVQSLARRLTRDPNEADELVQETWLKALHAAPPDGERARTWLGRTVRRVAWSRRRAERRRSEREERAARGTAAPTHASALEAQHRVVEAVLALPEPYRSTIVQRYYHELAPAEIARRDGLPPDTVKTRLRRGLALLRSRLKPADEGERQAFGAALALLCARSEPRSAAAFGAVLWKSAAVAALVAGGAAVLAWRGDLDGAPTVLGPAGQLAAATTAHAEPPGNEVRSAAAVGLAVVAPPRRTPVADREQEARIAYWQAVEEARGRALRFEGSCVTDSLAPTAWLDDLQVPAFVVREEESLTVVADVLVAMSGARIEVDPWAEEAAIDEGVVFDFDLAQPHSLRDLLGIVTQFAGADVCWVVEQGVARITTRTRARPDVLRFEHSVADLLVDPADYLAPDADLGDLFRPSTATDLAGLVTESVAAGTWELAGVSIEASGEALAVSGAPEVQREVERFLDHLRAFYVPGPDGRPGAPVGAWSEDLERARALRARFDAVSFRPAFGAEGPVALEEVALFLAQVAGIDVMLGRSVRGLAPEAREVRLVTGGEITVAEAFDRIADARPELEWGIRHGLVEFLESRESHGRQVLQLHDARDLVLGPVILEADDLPAGSALAAWFQDGGRASLLLDADALETLVRETVARASWDADPRNLLRVERGVVHTWQVPRVQAEIAALLETLRRACLGR